MFDLCYQVVEFGVMMLMFWILKYFLGASGIVNIYVSLLRFGDDMILCLFSTTQTWLSCYVTVAMMQGIFCSLKRKLLYLVIFIITIY